MHILSALKSKYVISALWSAQVVMRIEVLDVPVPAEIDQKKNLLILSTVKTKKVRRLTTIKKSNSSRHY